VILIWVYLRIRIGATKECRNHSLLKFLITRAKSYLSVKRKPQMNTETIRCDKNNLTLCCQTSSRKATYLSFSCNHFRVFFFGASGSLVIIFSGSLFLTTVSFSTASFSSFSSHLRVVVVSLATTLSL